MVVGTKKDDNSALHFLQQTSNRIASAAPLDEVLPQVLDFVTALAQSESCQIYVLDDDKLTLRAGLHSAGEKVTYTVTAELVRLLRETLLPAGTSKTSSQDQDHVLEPSQPGLHAETVVGVPLICHKRLVGLLAIHHPTQPRTYTGHEIAFLTTIGHLLGFEIGRAQLAATNLDLAQRLETRKIVERAKGILQRDLGLDEEESYQMLQRHSRQKRKPLKEIAEAVLLNDTLRRDHRNDRVERI